MEIERPEDPINAFRELIDKLEIGREEAAGILEKLDLEVKYGDPEEYSYLEEMGDRFDE